MQRAPWVFQLYISSASLLLTLANSGAIPPLVKTREFKDFSMSVNSLIVLILLFFMLLVDL